MARAPCRALWFPPLLLRTLALGIREVTSTSWLSVASLRETSFGVNRDAKPRRHQVFVGKLYRHGVFVYLLCGVENYMNRPKSILGIVLTLFFFGTFNRSAAQETKVTWLGHAAFSITTPKGKVLLIDPWLRNPANPDVKAGKDPLASISRLDYILLTHGHRSQRIF